MASWKLAAIALILACPTAAGTSPSFPPLTATWALDDVGGEDTLRFTIAASKDSAENAVLRLPPGVTTEDNARVEVDLRAGESATFAWRLHIATHGFWAPKLDLPNGFGFDGDQVAFTLAGQTRVLDLSAVSLPEYQHHFSLRASASDASQLNLTSRWEPQSDVAREAGLHLFFAAAIPTPEPGVDWRTQPGMQDDQVFAKGEDMESIFEFAAAPFESRSDAWAATYNLQANARFDVATADGIESHERQLACLDTVVHWNSDGALASRTLPGCQASRDGFGEPLPTPAQVMPGPATNRAAGSPAPFALAVVLALAALRRR